MKRIEPQQLQWAFAETSPQGEGDAQLATDESEAKGWLRRKARGKKLRGEITGAVPSETGLLEEVTTESNMASALQEVVRNQGAAGADGQSVQDVMESVRSLLPRLSHELRSGKYRPGDVRRVWIPKPEGGQRGLGIPNVMDRWVQQAVLQVLEPIWEPTFHASSHGFRPSRGAQTAVKEAKSHIAAGYNVVVDIDLSKFFDRVNHQRLMSRLAQKVKDPRVLKLIHQMLKAKVVMPDGTKVLVEEGTPQGGPLSPLLSNIVLDELDQELERRGLRFVRYADDSNIYVRSERAGWRVMDSIRRFIEKRLRLQINEEKSSVRSPHQTHFLGFRFTRNAEGEVEVRLSQRSRKRIAIRIREMTPRTWGQSLSACIEELNQYLKGWAAYFRLCSPKEASTFEKLDAHIRRRLRMIIIRQKKRDRFLFRHLMQRKVPRWLAASMAFSRHGLWVRSKTKAIHRAYPNRWFAERLMTLEKVLEPVAASRPRSGEQLLLFS